MKTSIVFPLHLLLALLLASITGSSALHAQGAPKLINYQGRLLNSDQTVFKPAVADLTFRIWDSETGGIEVWGPQEFKGVPMNDGYFNVILSTDRSPALRTIDKAFASTNAYIQVQAGSGPAMKRQRVLSTPYAMKAGEAAHAETASLALQAGTSSLINNGKATIASDGTARFRELYVDDAAGKQIFKVGWDGALRAQEAYFQSINSSGSVRAGSIGIPRNANTLARLDLGNSFIQENYGELQVGVDGRIARFRAHTFRLEADAGEDGTVYLRKGDKNYLSAASNGEDVWLAAPGDIYLKSARIKTFGPVEPAQSDARLKMNIKPVENASSKLSALKGVYYKWKDGRATFSESGTQVGVLAQDVKSVLPEAVHQGDDGMLRVDYQALVPVLIEAFKEQQKTIQQIEKELLELKSANQH